MLYELHLTNEVLGEMVEAKLALNIEVDKQEIYWEQKARVNWLRNEDKNIIFSIILHHNGGGTVSRAFKIILGTSVPTIQKC